MLDLVAAEIVIDCFEQRIADDELMLLSHKEAVYLIRLTRSLLRTAQAEKGK